VRQDRGDTGPDIVAFDNGSMPYGDARYIGYRVKRPGRQDADLHPTSRARGLCGVVCAKTVAWIARIKAAVRNLFMFGNYIKA
jgi:hypothetical protein